MKPCEWESELAWIYVFFKLWVDIQVNLPPVFVFCPGGLLVNYCTCGNKWYLMRHFYFTERRCWWKHACVCVVCLSIFLPRSDVATHRIISCNTAMKNVQPRKSEQRQLKKTKTMYLLQLMKGNTPSKRRNVLCQRIRRRFWFSFPNKPTLGDTWELKSWAWFGMLIMCLKAVTIIASCHDPSRKGERCKGMSLSGLNEYQEDSLREFIKPLGCKNAVGFC